MSNSIQPSEDSPRFAPDELVRACARGEDAAWRLFLRRYGDLVFSVPLKMGLSRSDAEEIFQMSVLAIYGKLGSLRDSARIVAWVAEVARRQTLHYLRKRSREANESVDELPELADERPLAAETIEVLETSQLLREALHDLRRGCQDLLTALYLTDPAPSYRQVSESLGVAIGSIGPTRARCLKALRVAMGSRGFGAAPGPRPDRVREKGGGA